VTVLLNPATFVSGFPLTDGTIVVPGGGGFIQPPTEALCVETTALWAGSDIQRLPHLTDILTAADACDGRPFIGAGDATPNACDDDPQQNPPILPISNNGDATGCPLAQQVFAGGLGFCPSRFALPSGSTIRTGNDGSVILPVLVLLLPHQTPQNPSWNADTTECEFDAGGVQEYVATIRISAGIVTAPSISVTVTSGS